ncbi:MAG: hypothetical protein ACRCTJ_07275 [Brevinema sp.]
MEKIILPRYNTQKKTTESIVISSRIDILRNIDGLVFPNKLPDYEKKLIVDQYQKICIQEFGNEIIYKSLEDCSYNEKKNLYANLLLYEDEQEIIEDNFSLFYPKDGSWIIAPNYGSHFHIYSSDFGLSLKEIYKRLSHIVDVFEEHIHFSFHHEFGYLVADTNLLGNGLSCQVVLNLAGLELSGYISDLQKVCDESRFSLTPLTSYAHEKLFILTNKTSFGISEHELISTFITFLQKLQETELNARKEITEKRDDKDFFASQVIQILSKKTISYHESLEFIAIIDMLHKIMYKYVDKTLWLEQIYRLQSSSTIFNNIKTIDEIDELRMKILTQVFNNTIISK